MKINKEKTQMKKILIGLSLVIGFGANAKAITLEESVNQALKANKSIKSYEKTLESKDNSVSSAWGRFAPSISLDAKYNYLNDDIMIDLNKIRTAMITLQAGDAVNMANLESVLKAGVPLTDQEKMAYQQGAVQKLEAALPQFKEQVKERAYPQASVLLKQPIFTGGKIVAGVNAAEAQRDMAQTKVLMETDEVIITTINSYLSYLLAQQNLQVRKEVYEGVLQHFKRAEKLFDEGIIANNDKLRAEVALSEAERNLYEAQEKVSLAKFALASIMETDIDNIPEPNEKLNFFDVSLDFNNIINQATAENYNIKTLGYAKQALDSKSDAKYADYLPTIYGFGFYNFFQNYLSMIEPKWGLGIGLQYELFNGFQKTNEYQAAEAEAEAMELLRQDTQRKIQLLMNSKVMNFKLAKEQYVKLAKAEAQADENLRLNERRFEEGLGTSLDAIDARLTLESIKLKRASYLFDYYSSLAGIYQTAGNAKAFIEVWNKGL